MENSCRRHPFQSNHFRFFKKNENDYSEGCQLFSLPSKIGEIQPVIVCFNDIPFSEEGWLYTVNKQYNIVDSLLLFSYAGTSETDDIAVLSSQTTAFWNTNGVIHQTKVNQVTFQNIDTTLIQDSILSIYRIQKNGTISFDSKENKTFNTGILEHPKNTNSYYKMNGKDESNFLKVSRVGRKVKLIGIQYVNDKRKNHFSLEGHFSNTNHNVLVGLKAPTINDKKEEWKFVFTQTTVKMKRNSDLSNEIELKKADYFSLPDQIQTDFYQLR